MSIRVWPLAAISLLAWTSAFAGHFSGWRKFGAGDDGSTFFYFPASVKPLHHYQTGKRIGTDVWAGWENTDGSYKLGRYGIHCDDGLFWLDGDVIGTTAGVETVGGSVIGQPYRPGTFVWLLAERVCNYGQHP